MSMQSRISTAVRNREDLRSCPQQLWSSSTSSPPSNLIDGVEENEPRGGGKKGDRVGPSGDVQEASEGHPKTVQQIQERDGSWITATPHAGDPLVTACAQQQQENKKDHDDKTKSEDTSIGTSRKPFPQISSPCTLLQRSWKSPADCIEESSSSFLGAVLSTDKQSEGLPVVAGLGSPVIKGSGAMERCESMDRRQGATQMDGEFAGLFPGVTISKDRPGGDCSSRSHHRPHPTLREGEENLEIRTQNLDHEPSQEFPIFNKQLHERNAEAKEGGGNCKLHRTEERESTSSSQKTIDEEGSNAARPSKRFDFNISLCSRAGQNGAGGENGHDEIDKPDSPPSTGTLFQGLELCKSRTMEALGIEQLPKLPAMPLNLHPYSSQNIELDMDEEDQSISTLIPLAYRHGIHRFRHYVIPSEGAVLNEPAVHTVNWAGIKNFSSEEKWEIINVVLDPQIFYTKVLNILECKDRDFSSFRAPPISRQIQNQIKHLLYVSRPKRSHPIQMCCSLFCVGRPDGKLRLIWDGRKLNQICRTPPKFHFLSIAEHLVALLTSKIKAFFTIDMRSWFVQLPPHPAVAAWFGTKLYDGLYIMMGLPMGWAWAPIIAQFTAEAVARCIVANIPELKEEGVIIIYIDNIILGLPSALATRPGYVQRKVRLACKALGAIIKTGSESFGPRVDWLGTTIDAETKLFKIKSSFIEKYTILTNAFVISPETYDTTLRTWYSILSSTIYANWIIQGSLIHLDGLLRWMSNLGVALSTNSLTWDSKISSPPKIAKVLFSLISKIVKNEWYEPPLSLANTNHWGIGISDASNLSMAWGWHSKQHMKLVIKHCPTPSNNIIFERELGAMIEGQKDLLLNAPLLSSYTWIGDNAGAIFVSRREVSTLWKVNPWLHQLHEIKVKKKALSQFQYIESKENPLDAPSRTSQSIVVQSEACREHPAERCPCFLKWIKEATPSNSS